MTRRTLSWLTDEHVFYRGYVVVPAWDSRPLSSLRTTWVVYSTDSEDPEDFVVKASTKKEAKEAIDVLELTPDNPKRRIQQQIYEAKQHVFSAQSTLHDVPDARLDSALRRSRHALESADRRVRELVNDQ